MKLKLIFSQIKIQKNLELFFVLLLILITIAITQIYNASREISKKEYINLINNLYFQKTVNSVFENFESRFLNINHKVTRNQTLTNIFKIYKIPNKEINLILKNFNKKDKIKNLKVNEIININIDKYENKVLNIMLPIRFWHRYKINNRTKKIELIRNLEKNSFIRKEIITNLKKKLVFKEAKITQSLYRSAVNEGIEPNIILEFAYNRLQFIESNLENELFKDTFINLDEYKYFIEEWKRVN